MSKRTGEKAHSGSRGGLTKGASQAALLSGPDALATLHRSPLTLAIAGLLVGYFLRYALGLWRATRTPVAEAGLP